MLDRIDIDILKVLQRNGRARIAAIAEAVGLSPTPCARRITQLEEAGVITGYTASIDAQSVGLPVTIFVSIELERQGADVLGGFEAAIADFEEVMDCFLLTGSQDYLLRVVAADLRSYETFLQEKLTQVAGIRSIRSRFALRQVIHRPSLPIRPGGAAVSD